MPPDEQLEDDVEVEELPSAPLPDTNLEDAFQNLFKTSASGTGEEELLRIASTFARQITSEQIRCIMYIEWVCGLDSVPEHRKKQLRHFVDRWLELKQFNRSDMFVMRALDSISLRKFIGENAFKINIEK